MQFSLKAFNDLYQSGQHKLRLAPPLARIMITDILSNVSANTKNAALS